MGVVIDRSPCLKHVPRLDLSVSSPAPRPAAAPDHIRTSSPGAESTAMSQRQGIGARIAWCDVSNSGCSRLTGLA
jgi:hypothetical protein